MRDIFWWILTKGTLGNLKNRVLHSLNSPEINSNEFHKDLKESHPEYSNATSVNQFSYSMNISWALVMAMPRNL